MAQGLFHGFPGAYSSNSITLNRDSTENVLENVEGNLDELLLAHFSWRLCAVHGKSQQHFAKGSGGQKI